MGRQPFFDLIGGEDVARLQKIALARLGNNPVSVLLQGRDLFPDSRAGDGKLLGAIAAGNQLPVAFLQQL